MSYYFDGDLNQLGAQRRLLSSYGFNIKMSNVYPTLETQEEFIKAISLLWTMKCEGWWHYREYYFENDICTPYEFWINLGSDRNVRLYHFVTRQEVWDNKVSLNGVNITDEKTIVNRGDVISVGDKEIIVK